MTKKGHYLFGAAFVASTVPTVYSYGDEYLTVGFVLAGLLGSTAPDWLEFRLFGYRLIRHRTITHWTAIWALAMTICLYELLVSNNLSVIPVLGFTLGGVTHCIADMGTKMGVPFLIPFKRRSLRLWSAQTQSIPIAIVWAAFLLSG